MSVAAIGILVVETLGPLTPVVSAVDPPPVPDGKIDLDHAFPNGRVVQSAPAPITVPAGGGDPPRDPTIGGEPLFLPYTPPTDTTELPAERQEQSRTLANPDGTFTTEITEGPINFQDENGAWQPIDLSLIQKTDSDGFDVAAHKAGITIGDKGSLGSISLNGHVVTLSSPIYGGGVKGDGDDVNKVEFAFPAEIPEPALWVRPIDIGLEFGATWHSSAETPTIGLHLDTGDLTAELAEDGRTIRFLTAEGKFAGRISLPILREGDEDGPPILDKVSVSLFPEVEGSGYSLSYAVDEKWFTDPERLFPIILDPTWCIGEGSAGAGCDDYTNSPNSFDTFVFDDDPSSYEIGWTVLRTGFDSRTGDGSFGKMRALLWFPQIALPDGAVIYDTDLQLTISSLWGGPAGESMSVYRLTKALSPNYTWNKYASAYSGTGSVSDTVPASGTMNWDVDEIMTAWYTRRAKAWKAPYGFLLRMDSEGSTHGEVDFERYNDGTASRRPLLTISYTKPVVGIDFDPRLGETYAPSTMVAGQPTTVPVVVHNKTGSAHSLDRCVDGADTDCWKVGYRWFDGKGNVVGSGVTTDLPATNDPISVDDESPIFPITVTPPATTGQYTLALDVVHYKTGRYWWASDFAKPSLYYSRNKKVLTSSSTRWTGSSAIERDEFSINVTEGVGGSNIQAVPVASGGQLGIDLATKNLSYSADTGLGFADRLPMSLTYGYNEAIGELCAGYQGVLGACGWYMNWDERIVGGSNQTGFDYSYVGPDGTPYMLDTDDSGQIAGGAPVLINRQRVTIIDENGGWDSPGGDGIPDVPAVVGGTGGAPSAFSGTFVAGTLSNATKNLYPPDKVSLNVYRKARFAIRTTSVTKAGICFKIHNLTDSTEYPDRWWCYTTGGTTAWAAGDDHQFISGTILNTWKYIDEDIYDAVRNDGSFGTTKDDYQVTAIRIESAGAGSGSTYVDGFRFESADTNKLDESNLSWTSGSGQTSLVTSAGDYFVGSAAVKINAGTGINPTCKTSNSCWGSGEGGMWAYPFVDWYWKKIGGSTAAMVFYLHNERSGADCNSSDCTLTYYAGAGPDFTGGGQHDAVIRIAPQAPTTWTNVRRNLLEDARQALNLFDDGGSGGGDDIRVVGFAPVAVDGSHLLLDRWAYGNLADVGMVDPTGPDEAGETGLRYHPNVAGDSTFTYDFMADYPDGSRHYFNRDGLLVRIRDKDRQAIKLDWSFDTAKAGPTAYSLTTIRAPTDGMSSGGTTFNRQFTITRGTEGSNPTIRFDEDLGATGGGNDPSTRAVIFVVGTGATPDLLKVSPARTQPADPDATGTFCPTPGAGGNGCIQFTYAGSHRLQYVSDPRWDGSTSGAADYRLEVGRSGNDPVSIKDRSHGGATLLNILSFNDGSSANYNRPVWQDAAAAAAGAAIAADLNPDGQTVTQYVPKACTAGNCVANPPTWTANYKAVDYEFDGLARVTTVKTYRCPVATDAINGCTGGEDVTMTRQETNSGAKVDNYADPLAGGRLAWRADADQVFASLRDSGGTNADWYRTEYVYDGAGQIAETIEVRELEVGNYPDAVKLGSPAAYWRLGDGPTSFTDSSGNGRTGTGASMSAAALDAMVRDGNGAAQFNGTSSKVTNSAVSLSTTAYSIEAWVRSGDDTQVSQGIAGRYLSDTGGKLYLKSTGAFGFQHTDDLVSSSIVPVEGRWYHVVGTWDGESARLFVDGAQVADTATSTATGTGSSNFEIGTASNGTSGFFEGSIDEVAVYSTALTPWDVAAHFRAGRAVATVDTTVRRDDLGRPLETATAFVANPGFEQMGTAWALGSGASVGTAEKYSGAASLTVGTTASTQIAQLVPGQTFRVQYATKSSVATASINVKIQYGVAGNTWTTLTGLDNNYTNTGWVGRAFDVTLPLTSDGRVKVNLTKSGTGSGYVDDFLLVTSWGLVAYNTATPFTVGYGLPTDRWGLAGCQSGPCSIPTVQTQLEYVANTTNPTYHPAIFPTKTIANYLDGTQGPGPAEDVTTRSAYDSWGRVLVATDPDGVKATTVFAANLTDVFQTKDGLNQVTEMTYDRIGNLLTTMSPLLRVTTSTYDGRNQQLTSISPDGTKSQTDYDNYGRPSASWANYVNGTVESGDGDLTDDLLSVATYDIFGHTITTKAECGELACSSGLRATSTSTFDLLGNTVASTSYPNANGGGTARTTTNHFEKTTPPAGTPFANIRFSRTQPTGVQAAIAPSGAPAPICPGAASQRCNKVTTVDLSGYPIVSTDAYGIKTVASYDIGGKPVRTIANYVNGSSGPGADEDVTSTVVYNLVGDPVESWDPLSRHDERLYDQLGRLLQVSHRDTTDAEFLKETTDYKPSGRVDRTFDGSAWTRTIYDGAGRAVKTIANSDQGGAAGMTLDGLEGGTGAWQFGSSGFFTSTASNAITTDEDPAGNGYHSMPPVSGHGRLHITTHATNSNDGAWLDITGDTTYQSGHTYKASFDLATSAANLPVTVYLGQDQSGGSYGSLAIANSTTTWTRYTVSWTAGSNLGSNVRFAIRKTTAGTSEIYLDNLVVWDTKIDVSPPRDWSQTGIVSSASAYNADGEITASVLPPGDPGTERPLVTTVAFDAAGQTVSSVVNGTSGAYAAAINGTASVVAYLPLDERIGTSIADVTGGAVLSVTGPVTHGLAGGIDEARTADRFSGGRLSRATNATSGTANISIEAWLRTDAGNPASTVVVAANGTQANGWGIGVDSSGNAAGVAISASTLTTMSSSKVVTDGAWHHVVVSRGASVWKVTVDGTAYTPSNSTTSPGTPGAGLSVGALSDGTRPFTGEVDEVAVYTADISGAVTTAHFAAGRQTDTVTALTTRTAFDRLGRSTDSWTPKLSRSRFAYDRLGNLTETVAHYVNGTPSDGATVDDDVKSTFGYDVLGELIGYCPAVQVLAGGCDPTSGAEDQAWRYEFDAMGRQTRTIPPVNQLVSALTTEETVYQAGGRVDKTCRYAASGGSCGSTNSRHVDFTYDNLGRVLTQKTYDRGAGSDTLKFTKTLTWLADGKPSTVNEGSDTLTYQYDTAGRLSQFKRGATVLTAYTYTADTSTIATRTDGSQGAVTYSYDWARRTTTIDPPDAFVTGTVTRTYRLDGLLATQAFPSSITETLSYDAAKRPLSISLGGAGSISQAFDRAGNVVSDGRSLTAISGDAGGNTQTFSYDGLSRLLSSSGLTASANYEYDLDGNRTKRVEGATTTTYNYDRADQIRDQTIGVTTKTYTYDAYGNLTQSADKNSAFTTFSYDEALRLTGIMPPAGGAITFTMDALDRHATRLVGGSTTDTYNYLDTTETAWQTGTGGSPTAAILDVDGSRLAVKTGSTVSWLLFDLHGSVVAMCTSGTSTLTDAYRFDGWGQQIASAGTATNPWRYRGLLNIGTDPGTTTGALLDMNARDYSPQLGTFTQQDSVQGSAANPASMNRFLYAQSNPATLIDPDGHAAGTALNEWGGGGGGVSIQPFVPPGGNVGNSFLNVLFGVASGVAVGESLRALQRNAAASASPVYEPSSRTGPLEVRADPTKRQIEDVPFVHQVWRTDWQRQKERDPDHGPTPPLCRTKLCRLGFVAAALGTTLFNCEVAGDCITFFLPPVAPGPAKPRGPYVESAPVRSSPKQRAVRQEWLRGESSSTVVRTATSAATFREATSRRLGTF